MEYSLKETYNSLQKISCIAVIHVYSYGTKIEPRETIIIKSVKYSETSKADQDGHDKESSRSWVEHLPVYQPLPTSLAPQRQIPVKSIWSVPSHGKRIQLSEVLTETLLSDPHLRLFRQL